MDILFHFNLVQHINEPTYKLENTSDLNITRKTSMLLNHKVDFQISDHNNILFQIYMQKPAYPQKVVKFRKLKKVKMEELRKDIKETSDRDKTINDLVALVDHYNHEVSRILDKHAPEEERHVTLRTPTPWTSEDIKLEKQKRRRLERIWRKTRLLVDENAFKRQMNRVNALLNAFIINYNSALVTKNANYHKSLFRIINRLLHRKEETPMPPHTSESDLELCLFV